MPPPDHHKEVARQLRQLMPGEANVSAYRDEYGRRPIPIGRFKSTRGLFYSTIGAFDNPKDLPAGDFEFAAAGRLAWLPNAIASSIYWLKERKVADWPLICEDAVRHNVRSPYRHMAYIPSAFRLVLSTGQQVQWLLGVPIKDKEIGVDIGDVMEKAKREHPSWLFREGK
jgi:hypothetical protein